MVAPSILDGDGQDALLLRKIFARGLSKVKRSEARPSPRRGGRTRLRLTLDNPPFGGRGNFASQNMPEGRFGHVAKREESCRFIREDFLLGGTTVDSAVTRGLSKYPRTLLGLPFGNVEAFNSGELSSFPPGKDSRGGYRSDRHGDPRGLGMLSQGKFRPPKRGPRLG
ncbi:hypothetical protein RRG08_015259 [Elysia crispata]|uniref:Uncharacterized protein n=1 Tax=Elysia crispata TaxID=231223 RepID=A0AAE0Z029_9GAST|nr:hypothetical protein RRG08_015259 [Elysia crispata]